MPKDYAALPANALRRRDRALDENEIVALLERAPMGNLATVHDGQPFINSNTFFYHQPSHAIYMHTSHVGRTPANVAAEARVCFSVSEMGRLLPADTAMEFSVEYSGVVVFGRAQLMDDAEGAKQALQWLLDKYFGHLQAGRDYRPTTDAELALTGVYRIAIDAWSGKRKQAAADFPGAFWYGDGRTTTDEGPTPNGEA